MMPGQSGLSTAIAGWLPEFPKGHGRYNTLAFGRRTIFFIRSIGFGIAKDRHRLTDPTALVARRPLPFDIGSVRVKPRCGDSRLEPQAGHASGTPRR